MVEPTPDLPFAVSLEPAPEIGTPDLTKFEATPFPKGAEQRACYRYLLDQMLATPDRPNGKKSDFKKTCLKKFGVAGERFEAAWREALKATGAHWNHPGRRRRR